MVLTGKKRLFADAVLAGKSNKDAAIAAGYSAHSASAAGSRLVKDPKVALYLSAARGQAEADAPKVAPTAPVPLVMSAAAGHYKDPKEFLLDAMNMLEFEPKHRLDAAKALMPFMHQKLGEGGKKEQAQANAEKVASRFGALAPPPMKH